MKLISNLPRRVLLWVALAALAGLSLLSVGSSESPAASLTAAPRSSDYGQLVSYQSLVDWQGGEACVMTPVGARLAPSLVASLAAGLPASLPANVAAKVVAASFQEETRILARDPVRTIRDPYSGFSAVAVDMERDEVIVTDENLFQVLVFDRLDNTPPWAAMTEPKRILGGSETKIQFQCGLYIDQETGDFYAVNNDTVDTIVIFSRQAEGNVKPDRELSTPHGAFGIAVSEEHDELFVTVQHDQAIVVYHKTASENDSPIRLIQGDRTGLADPHGTALDTKNDLLFVANYGSTHKVRSDVFGEGVPSAGNRRGRDNWPLGREHAVPGSGSFHPPSITVYARTASGDTPPLRRIQGPRTQLNWPTGLAFHSQRGELFVANDMGNSILVFDGEAAGNVAPKRVLKGPKTGIDNPTSVFVDTKNEELWVANFGAHSVTAYEVTASGDTAPLRTIRSSSPDKPSLMIGNPGAIDYDSRRGELLVPN